MCEIAVEGTAAKPRHGRSGQVAMMVGEAVA
jgi:hypothetical protein